MRKRSIFVLAVVLMSFALMFTGCAQQAAEPVDVRVTAMNGPTAMGMVQFMSENESGNIKDNNYSFEIAKTIDEALPKVTKGEVDIAAVPANVASVLFNNTKGAVQVLAINTLGVLYIVENGETVQSLQDLKGKTIYAAGKGATPEYALTHILASNGLDKEVTVEWKSEQTEVVAAVSATEGAVAMLPQPFATSAQMTNTKIKTVLDLTKEWDKIDDDSALVTGVVVVNTEFAKANPSAVEDFMDHYEDSVEFINEKPSEGAELVVKYGILPKAPIAEKAIPLCNITCIDDDDDLKPMLSGYLKVLFDQNPKSIGGAMPTDDFYYNED